MNIACCTSLSACSLGTDLPGEAARRSRASLISAKYPERRVHVSPDRGIRLTMSVGDEDVFQLQISVNDVLAMPQCQVSKREVL